MPEPTTPAVPPIAGDFPAFKVPGQERAMDLVRQLYWLHYRGQQR